MKKTLVLALTALVVLGVLSGCMGFGRGHGPLDAFQFSASKNPSLDENVNGTINEGPDPAVIEVVVPPGTDVRRLVATLSLNQEATITVLSSGSRVVQQNGVTANDFSAPVLYSLEVPKEKKPWRYSVTVREAETDATLAQISVPDSSGLQPSFSVRTRSYTAVVPYDATKVRIEVRGSSPNLSSISIDGATTSGATAATSVDFSTGTQRSVSIDTVAEDGETRDRYVVLIKRADPERNALLSALEIGDVALAPSFSPTRTSYQTVVPYDTKQFVLRATPQGKFATVALAQVSGRTRLALEYRGNPTDRSGATIDFPTGEAIGVAVGVTAQDGSLQEYLVDVRRAEPDHNNQLSELGIEGATWATPFNLKVLSYVAEVPYSTRVLSIGAVPQSKLATVSLEPGPLMSRADAAAFSYRGNPIARDGAQVDFTDRDRISLYVSVQAQDGRIQRYALDIRRGEPDRNANLGSLETSAGVLSPFFNPRIVSYVVSLPAAEDSVKITATAASRVALVEVSELPNLKPAPSVSFVVTVAAGAVEEANLVVTAEDGTQRLYRIRVSREAQVGRDSNARLGSLQVANHVLQPAFSPTVYSYRVQLDASEDSCLVTARAESAAATVALDGKLLDRGGAQVAVEAGGSRTVAIDVTAENGSVSRTTLRIEREAAVGPRPPGPNQVTIYAQNLRLQTREVNAVSQRGERIGTSARLTVRYYRSNETLVQETAKVDWRQSGSTWLMNLDWRSASLNIDQRRLVEIEVAIATTGKGYLYYGEARRADESLDFEVPFLLYGDNPRISWPAIGKATTVEGYVSLLPPGQQRGERAIDRESFEKDVRGEYGITVEFIDAAGRVVARETVRTRPGLPREHVFAFSKPIQLPEGTTLKYTLTAKAANGRVWQSNGTASIWTTLPAYAGGFQPVILALDDDLQAGR